jgi:hypothetical protein
MIAAMDDTWIVIPAFEGKAIRGTVLDVSEK